MAIVPQEVPVEKPIKAAKTKVNTGTTIGDSDHCTNNCETNSAVCISLVTNAMDHAIVRISTALNIDLKPSTISSIILAKVKLPRSKVITIAVSNEANEAHRRAL